MTDASVLKTRNLLDHPALRQILPLLGRDGEEARVVGGAVRNALMGRGSTDVDIATTAVPDVVIARAREEGIRTIPTGIAHGTVTLLVDGTPYEVTTLREDVETDGRHAKIRFGRDFAQDALRRDFTINALSVGLDGVIHDYAGGLDDIAAGRVRFIGDPTTRIREDYLRILRFFRFSAEYAAGAFDAAGLSAAVRERAGLARLSRERIRQEVLKLLSARRAADGVAALSESGLAGPLLRSVAQPARLRRLIAIDPAADAILRLAATVGLVREDADRLRDTLRLSNAETGRLAQALETRETMRGDLPPLSPDLRRLLYARGRRGALDGLALAWIDCGAPPDDPSWRAAHGFLLGTPEPKLPFSGTDLSVRGIGPGKQIGAALSRLEHAWIRDGLPDDPARLDALLEEVLGRSQP